MKLIRITSLVMQDKLLTLWTYVSIKGLYIFKHQIL